MEVPSACTLPPPGWWCSRDAGHDGPCAARRTIMVDTVVDQEAVEAAGEGLELDLTGVYVLPQATLKELAAKGVIMSVMTFEDHMNPTVHWIEPEEFGRAFEELTSGENSMADDKFEAAHTDPHGSMPSFINARAGLVPGTVLITVRSAKSPDGSHGDGAALDGATAHHIIDIESLDQWIADLQRLRQALG